MSKAVAQDNILQVTPNEWISVVTPLYSSGEDIPSVMLWGPPGVGKSDAVRGLAKKLGEQTKKTVNVTDVRLLLFNPVDLRGIPVPDVNKEFTKWLKPTIFNLDPSEDVINIVFLDEITAAPPTVQAAAYQLTLDKKVGEHTLPKNTFVIAAGNRVVDKGVAYKMPTPLANRMTHFEFYADIEDWKEWAIPNGVDPIVLGFLGWKPSLLNGFDPKNEWMAFPTPRSWMMVSKYMKIYGKIERAFKMIAGTIGMGPAQEFKAFAATYGELPDVQDILDGKEVRFTERPDIMYALCGALISHVPNASQQQLINVCNFTMNKLPEEYAVLCVKDMLRIDGIRSKIMGNPAWIAWAKEHKAYIV